MENIKDELNNIFNNKHVDWHCHVETEKINILETDLNKLFDKNNYIYSKDLIAHTTSYRIDYYVWFKIITYKNGYKEIYRGNAIKNKRVYSDNDNWIAVILDDDYALVADKITESDVINKHNEFMNNPRISHDVFMDNTRNDVISCTNEECCLYNKYGCDYIL